MTFLHARCAIAVMAKVPQPGRSKTRLIPLLGAEGAAAMSAAFLRDTTENIALAAGNAPIDGWAAYAPAGLEPALAPHLAAGTKLLLADGALACPPGVEGFGRCLLHAIATLLDMGYGAACVLNSDGPTLPTAYLAAAAGHLLRPGRRAVLGPAEDGGYYLLGLQATLPPMFADIAWSTDGVADATRARAGGLVLPMVELPLWHDVDDADGLRRLLATVETAGASGAYAAPATSACMTRLGLRARLRADADMTA